MRWMKWTGLAAALVLIISCFLTWVIILSKNIVATGVDAEAIGFGRPGYLHLFFSSLFILFTFIQKVWAKRSNLIVAALNLAWAARNYFVISVCSWGECPEKHAGLYLIPLTSLILMVAALFPDIKLSKQQEKK
ncbi:MAG: hypothetical protein WDN26_03550 [Chitinophagaceae bacterium]